MSLCCGGQRRWCLLDLQCVRSVVWLPPVARAMSHSVLQPVVHVCLSAGVCTGTCLPCSCALHITVTSLVGTSACASCSAAGNHTPRANQICCAVKDTTPTHTPQRVMTNISAAASGHRAHRRQACTRVFQHAHATARQHTRTRLVGTHTRHTTHSASRRRPCVQGPALPGQVSTNPPAQEEMKRAQLGSSNEAQESAKEGPDTSKAPLHQAAVAHCNCTDTSVDTAGARVVPEDSQHGH